MNLYPELKDKPEKPRITVVIKEENKPIIIEDNYGYKWPLTMLIIALIILIMAITE